MSTMNISLPATLKAFVDAQVTERGYDDHVDVWRVLHGKRDIPAWIRSPDNV